MKYLESRFIRKYQLLLLISSANFLLVYLSSFVKGYGYFIDEFYYIACALRPAFGYVDHPPLSPLILTAFQFFFGTSLLAIRVLPALAESASIFFTGILVKEMGGGRFAQCLGACAMATSPVIVTFAGFYSMNAYEPLLAILLLIFAVKMIKENNPRRWVSLGVIMGLGIMNKHTFAVFIAALLFSLLISGQWRLVINKWAAAGLLITLLMFLPNIIWQIQNGYPSLEFYRNAATRKNVYTPPLAFVFNQVLDMSPFIFPVWFAGVFYLLFSKTMKDFRSLSVLFLTLFLLMMLSGTSRPDRLAFAYPAVIAGGAVYFGMFISKHGAGFLKPAFIVSMYAGLAITLPIVLPYFGYRDVAAYTKFLGLNTEVEAGNKPPLPQILADRIGWKEKFRLVFTAYNSLSEEEKHRTIIAAGNYGQAGAIELYGRKYNLPPVVCGHNTYYLWSRNKLWGNIVIQLGHAEDLAGTRKRFEKVEEFPEEFKSPYVTAHENNLKVFICRDPKIPYPKMLDMGKIYY